MLKAPPPFPDMSRRLFVRQALRTVSAVTAGSLCASAAWADGARDSKRPQKRYRSVSPLSQAHQKVLRAIPPDTPPKKLIGGQHFYISDEARPEKFRSVLEPAGGIYIGVGPEQNYLYAGWARPEVMVLLDFDQVVVDIHELYGCFFRVSKTADAMLRLWSKRGGGFDVVKAQVSDAQQRARLRSIYYGSHPAIHARLVALQRRFRTQRIDTFLSDDAHYRYVREMFLAGRVRAVRGDFTKSKTMNGIATAAKKLGLPIRCLYLSNVEQYFSYKTGIRHNVEVQPTVATSTILRTVASAKHAVDHYEHVVQRYDHFRAWLASDVLDVQTMMREANPRIDKTEDAWVLPGPA